MNTSPAASHSPSALAAADRASVLHPFSHPTAQATFEPRLLVSAKGIRVTDVRGTEYLDAGSGLWCVNVGYGRTEIAEAMFKQSKILSYALCFGSYSNEPLIALSNRLLELAPPSFSKVLYNNSGSEANDAQIKIVRYYNNLRGLPKKKKIIARLGSYHGASIGSGSLTGTSFVHRHFDLPMDGILHTDAPDFYRRADPRQSEAQFCQQLIDHLEQLIRREGPETVAAFIAEPVMGSCGVIPPPAGYFDAVQDVLKQNDILLIADEVITGFGRLGYWFGGEHFKLRPDLVTSAKGLTSGYFPMSACLVGDKVWDVLAADREAGLFGHGFTTAGHPVAAAVALKNIEIIEREQLLANATGTGAYLLGQLKRRLGDHPLVGDIRGVGLMCGVELDADKATCRPFEHPLVISSLFNACCWEEGLIVRGAHGKVMAALAPPLTLTPAEADELVTRLGRGLERLTGKLAAGVI
jgi:L-2,4-diaminobutyrate transaminase